MTTDIKTKLDYTVEVGNFLVGKIVASPFNEVPQHQANLKQALERITELFGETAKASIEDINRSSYLYDKLTRAFYQILHSAINISEAKSFNMMEDDLKYLDSYFDDLWEAVSEAGIEYEDPAWI